MTATKYLADSITQRMPAGFDPLTIFAVLSQLIPILISCWKTPVAAAEHLRNRSLRTDRMLKRHARSVWQQHGHGAEKGSFEAFHAAVLAECDEITPELVDGLYRDANEATGEWRAVT